MRHLALLPLALILSPAAEGQQAPRVVLETPSGELDSLPLTQLDLEAVGGRDAAFVRLEGLEAPPGPPPEDSAMVELAGGDRVHADVRGGEGDVLQLELLGAAPLEVVVDRVLSVVFPGRISAEARAGLGPAESGDLLYWLRPGGTLDRVPGTLLAFDQDGPRLEGAFGERTFPWSEVAALYVEALGEAPEPPGGEVAPGLRVGAAAVVELADGGRLRGRLRALSAGGMRLEHAPARVLDLALGAVAEVAADDGRVRFLSDLQPALVEEGSPFGDDLGLRWPHRMDRSVTGAPLRAGGRIWRRGIGVHAPSRLVFALDGGWARLRGSVAVDDQVLLLPARGSVVFRVLVDGEVRWSSETVRGGETPLELPPVDLAGALELALEVDMAEGHYVADRADWLRPLLVRAP